jgi:hypothetical protein
MRDPVDTITGPAIRCGLEPGVDPRQGVRDLDELAQAQGSLLQRAVGRVETSMGRRTSRAGDDVLALLDRALAVVDAPPTAAGLEAATCGSR